LAFGDSMRLIEGFDLIEEGGNRDRGSQERCLKCGMRGGMVGWGFEMEDQMEADNNDGAIGGRRWFNLSPLCPPPFKLDATLLGCAQKNSDS
jgi:hypothetical protein